jgi:hypothetical protein
MTTRKDFSPKAFFALTTIGFLALVSVLWAIHDSLNPHMTNVVVSLVVFFQGLAALQIVWGLEMDRGGASFPFAWSFLAAQHLSFGVGGVLVSVFDQSYLYSNEQGLFSWEEAILPLLLAHALSINAGLFGTWIGIHKWQSKRVGNGRVILQERDTLWQWEPLRGACYISLPLHMIIWIFFGLIKDPSPVVYLIQVLGQCTNATFILWGLVWARCSHVGRWIFIICAGSFGLIEAIEGNRGFFAWPVVLFAMGYLVSTRGRIIGFRTVIKWSPLIAILFFGAIKSEDVRTEFSRGAPTDTGEAIDRFAALLGPEEVSPVQGNFSENMPFRLGSRLFELSAADVITRTPDDIPFWGWTDEDWSILLTGFVPLKLNPSADYNNDRDAGVLFLQSYGWIYVDPSQGTSMPATLVGDSWRRFGKAGVIMLYVFWSFVLAKMSVILRFRPRHIILTMFGLALAANTVFYYVSDMTYLVSSLPRRMAIMLIYAILIWGVQLLWARGRKPTVFPVNSGPTRAVLG